MRQLPALPLKASNLLTLLLLTATMLQARRISSRRLVIHVPVKVKTHHHTHTVYKVLRGAAGGGGGSGGGGIKQTVYKVVGFSGEGGGGGGSGHGDMGHGSHSHSPGHSYGHSHSHSHGLGLGLGLGMGMGMGEITYEDKHGCESGKLMPSHRDMLFNHYARHDQEQAENGDYAEERDEFIDVRDAWL
ncbi:keratin, type I cytoskeletal 10 [Drosophila navojoa]|nr:keratin, type I cytoskeletal 10 [Drosophila navojoa]